MSEELIHLILKFLTVLELGSGLKFLGMLALTDGYLERFFQTLALFFLSIFHHFKLLQALFVIFAVIRVYTGGFFLDHHLMLAFHTLMMVESRGLIDDRLRQDDAA